MLLAALLAGALLLAGREIRPRLEAALSGGFGAETRVGGLRLSPRAEATLFDVRIGPGDGPRCERVEVDPDFRRVVRGDPVLNRLALHGLRASIEPTDDGGLRIRGLDLSASPGDGPSPDVREIVVRGAQLGIAPPAPLRERIDLRIDRLVARQAPCSLPGAKVYLVSASGLVDGVPASAEAIADSDAAGTRVEADLRFDGGSVDGTRFPRPEGLARIEASVSGHVRWVLDTRADRRDLAADLDLSGVALETDGKVVVSAGRANLRGIGADLGHGGGWRADHVEVLDGRVTLPRAAGGDFVVDVPRIALEGLDGARAGTLGGVLRLPGGGTASLAGSVGGPAKDFPSGWLQVDAKLVAVALADVLALLPEPPLGLERGVADGRFRVALGRGAPTVEGEVDARSLGARPRGTPLETLTAERARADLKWRAEPASLAIGSLLLDRVAARIVRAGAGDGGGSTAPTPTPTVAPTAASAWTIRELRVTGAALDVADPEPAPKPSPGPGRAPRRGSEPAANLRLEAASLVARDLAGGDAVRGGAIELSGGKLRLPIRTGSGGRRTVDLAIPTATLGALDPGTPQAVTGTVRPPGGGTISLRGRATLDPPSAAIDCRLADVSLVEAMRLASADLPLARGRASGDLHLAVDAAGLVDDVDGDLRIDDLYTEPPDPAHPEEVIAVHRVEARFAWSPLRDRVEIERAALRYPYAMIQRRDGRMFPATLLPDATATAGAARAGSPPAAPPRPVEEASGMQTTAETPVAGNAPVPAGGARASGPNEESLDLEIRSLEVTGGRLDFIDRSAKPVYWTGLAGITGNLAGASLPGGLPSMVSLSAMQDELAPVRIEAHADGPRVRGRATGERLALPSFNAYLESILGQRAERGLMNIVLDAGGDGARIEAKAKLRIEDASFVQTGLDVVGRQTGVPFPVALAMLRDPRGTLELDVPFSLDRRSGEIALGSVLGQAIGRATLGAITSPLRLLGMMFGRNGPPQALAIDPVPFAAGSSELGAEALSRVEQVRRILGAHPDLVLVAKAQLSAADRALAPGSTAATLAERRTGALRDALLGSGGPTTPVDPPMPSGPPSAGIRIAPGRVVVVPWAPEANPGGDPVSGIYVELRADRR